MKNTQKRLAKKWKREHRETKKDGSWYCSCGERHPQGHRCPNYFGGPAPSCIPSFVGLFGR